MKFPYVRWGLARSLVAISVSLAVVVSTQAFAFASLRAPQPADSSPSEFQLIAASASSTRAGVLIQWQTNAAADNLGFNIYRLQDGQRTRVNRGIIPGAVFATGARAFVRSGYSYSWFDRSGTPDSIYYIESVNLEGSAKTHEAVSPAVKNGSPSEQTPETMSAANALSPDSFVKGYPAAGGQLNFPAGAQEDQWAIAGQSALKIGIKKDGWYRVTQAQMAAAGFDPSVDIRNLQLFADALEVAINTSQRSGTFQSGDYIEFYGRGLDTTTTDTRTYYLIAGTVPGKRVGGEMQLDDSPRATPTPTPTPEPNSSPTPASTPTPMSSPTSSPISTPLSSPSPPAAPPQSQPTAPRAAGPVLQDPIFYSRVDPNLFALLELPGREGVSVPGSSRERDNTPTRNTPPDSAQLYDPQAALTPPDISAPGEAVPVASHERATADAERRGQTRENATPPANNAGSLRLPVVKGTPSPKPKFVTGAAGRVRKRAVSKKRKRSTTRRAPKRELQGERNHALLSAGFTPSTFDFTVERKDRTVYYSNLLNGDTENFFGQVISGSPASQTITIPNPDVTAAGPAKLEVAMQGVNFVNHQVTVKLNGTALGLVLPAPPQSFFGQSHVVATFDVPLSLIQNGTNTLTFTPPCQPPLPSCPDTTIVDYVRLTYPHKFLADSGSLRFNLRGTQTVTVDGFATPSVLLVDYTDPLAVSLSRPASAPSANGFAIDVPLSEPISKTQRLLLALPVGQFDQPASLSLNQPSSLNSSSNSGDFLIIAHQDFLASVEPLRVARANQGLTAKVVDVEDVYDEFSYGEHGPEAIKSFLNHAATHWNSGTGTLTPPRYVVFVGDSSYDARDYANFGHYDFVPTKLIDATYNETVSDDWLTDFDDDGNAEIPVGRIPVRTAAEADLVVSKILNYVPANVPQTAILIADDPSGGFDFEEGNYNVQQILAQQAPTMTVQRVNVRTEGAAQATVDIRDGINQGRAIVNYSGHGNVNIWSSQSIWGTGNANALTNGMNKLTFVIVMDCLNGYFQDPGLLSLSEAFLKAPNGGAVAAFASSGLTTTYGQRQMELELYRQLYGSQPIAVGDAIKLAKAASFDLDVRRTWIFFGDPSMKMR